MNHEKKIPLIRLAKRDGMESWKVWCIRCGSILFALLLGALVMALAGANPVTAYGTMISGALGKKSAIRQTVKIAVPLLGCALAIAPCFKMRFWNIGAEGQITAGAIAASYFALFWANRLPSPVLLLVMGLAGALAGGLWALIPAFFKAKWNTNETLFTLMMNYIIIGVVRWLQGGPWEGRKGSQIIPQFDEAACLPRVLGVHCGWIIVLVLVVFMHIYMNHTKHGYEIAVIGDSVNTARYAGMNVGRVMMRTMFLSGAINRSGHQRHRRIYRGLRGQQHAVRRRGRRRRLHLHHRGLAQPAQRLRHGGHLRPAGGVEQGGRDPPNPHGGAYLHLRHHHRHIAVLHAGL